MARAAPRAAQATESTSTIMFLPYCAATLNDCWDLCSLMPVARRCRRQISVGQSRPAPSSPPTRLRQWGRGDLGQRNGRLHFEAPLDCTKYPLPGGSLLTGVTYPNGSEACGLQFGSIVHRCLFVGQLSPQSRFRCGN